MDLVSLSIRRMRNLCVIDSSENFSHYVSEIIGVEAGYVRFQKFDIRGDDIRILYGRLNNVFDAVLGY